MNLASVMTFLGSPYVKYQQNVRLAETMSAFLPSNKFSTGVRIANLLEYRHQEIYPLIASNYQSVMGATEQQAFEFAKSYYRNLSESHLADAQICSLSQDHFRAYAAKAVLATTQDDTLDILQSQSQPIVLGAFQFSSLFNLYAGIAELTKNQKTLHILSFTKERHAAEHRLLNKYQRTYDVKFWQLQKNGDLRKCLRDVQKENSILICHCDLDGSSGVWGDCMFMGKSAGINICTIRIAQFLKAAIIPCFAHGNVLRDGHFTLNFADLIENLSDIDIVIERLVENLENAILTHPWEWRRWLQVEKFYHSRT